MSERIPDGVICYWQYKAPPDEDRRRTHRYWELVEAYPVDMDGYPLSPVQHTGDINTRHEWDNWMRRKTACPEGVDPEDHDYDGLEDIMGRAVTYWNWTTGVQLLDFTPPEYVAWLSIGFYEKLCKNKERWIESLEDGHDLYFGTSNRAMEVIGNYLRARQ